MRAWQYTGRPPTTSGRTLRARREGATELAQGASRARRQERREAPGQYSVPNPRQRSCRVFRVDFHVLVAQIASPDRGAVASPAHVHGDVDPRRLREARRKSTKVEIHGPRAIEDA